MAFMLPPVEMVGVFQPKDADSGMHDRGVKTLANNKIRSVATWPLIAHRLVSAKANRAQAKPQENYW